MLNSRFFRFVSVVCLTFSLGVLTFADTIRLKDGSIIKGKIINFNGGKFTVVIGDDARQRQMSFSAEEVESIVFDSDTGTVAANVQNTDSANKNVNAAKDTTVITAGQNNKEAALPVALPKPDLPSSDTTRTDKTANNSQTSATSQIAPPKPITIEVKVLADNSSNGWTNSGFVVQKGQKIKITGSGRVSLGSGRYVTAGGVASIADADKLKKDDPTGGLIAVIGDDNNEFIFIGESREFVAARDGALFLGVNEGNLDDNSGTFDARIEIFPDK